MDGNMMDMNWNWSVDASPWLVDNYQLFLVPALIYIPFVHYGQSCKFNMNLRWSLFLWNIMLALYSAATVIAIAPAFVWRLWNRGYIESICLHDRENSFFEKPYGMWILLFITSKVVELGDTAFLVFRGKNVGFLHWYHHVATLAIAYAEGVVGTPTLEWGCMMNTIVHTWMYGHYALTTVFPNKNRQGNMMLTMLQIAQMIHGVIVAIVQITVCGGGGVPNYSCATIYTIYTLLFCQFFVQKYRSKKDK